MVCRFPRQIDRGLSPQVRGNPIPAGRYPCGGGSIPAGAGEPTCCGFWTPPAWVYPRRCGGTDVLRVLDSAGLGLSPQVRGNPPQTTGPPARLGSIPAGAGEPRPGCAPGPRARVYPRRCGGTIVHLLADARSLGLSPQVRGNHRNLGDRPVKSGSIPAGAGEPVGVGGVGGASGVYPRRCGGTDENGAALWPEQGLSPQVRGNPEHGSPLGVLHGSIPAGAGEPRATAYAGTASGVYPRRCGGTTCRR